MARLKTVRQLFLDSLANEIVLLGVLVQQHQVFFLVKLELDELAEKLEHAHLGQFYIELQFRIKRFAVTIAITINKIAAAIVSNNGKGPIKGFR